MNGRDNWRFRVLPEHMIMWRQGTPCLYFPEGVVVAMVVLAWLIGLVTGWALWRRGAPSGE